MSTVLDNLRYIKTHEWIAIEGDIATVGITDFAQDQLGDVVYVELPAIGHQTQPNEGIAVIESVKTASDIYSPLAGEIIAINESLLDKPEQINESPYENGWLFKVRFSQLPDDLLSADQYRSLLE